MMALLQGSKVGEIMAVVVRYFGGVKLGTAGKPMMALLQGSKVGEIMAVVVRYFGGVKLGTG